VSGPLFWYRRCPHWSRLAIGLTVGAAAGALAVWNVDLEHVWSVLERVSLWPLITAFCLVAVTQWIKVVRWQIIAGGREQLPAGLAWRGVLVGQAANLLLPARAGDVVRAVLVGRRTNSGSIYTLYTVFIEKAWEAGMLLVCSALLLAYGPWPDWLSRWGVLASALSLVVLTAGVFGVLACRNRLLVKSQQYPWMTRFLVPASQLSQTLAAAWHNGGLLRAGACSVGIWLLGLVINWTTFSALGVSVHWSASLLVLVAIYVGVVVPAPPGRVGLFHYVVRLALTAYDVPDSQALACGVLLHLVVIVPLMIAGGVAALAGQGVHG